MSEAAGVSRFDAALKDWTSLNAYLMRTRDVETLAALLEAERAGRNRRRFVLRIHSRFNRMRRLRERRPLGGV